MAPIKRKQPPSRTDEQPKKRQRPVNAATVPKQEPSFPRGGANVLTPLEQKQIQIQAKQDVLFEQSTGKKVQRADLEEEGEDGLPSSKSQEPSKPKKLKKRKSGKSTEPTKEKEKVVRIEGLSYRRLCPGTLVLGQISQINRHDIALNLPNNLTGFIPLNSISDQITGHLENLADEEDDSQNEDDVRDTPDLQSMFHVGQYLRAQVISTEDQRKSHASTKKHISLSIHPQKANASLTKAELVPNSMIQASVLSVEDHGYRMDLGLEDKAIHGFLALKDVGKDVDRSAIKEGAVLLCMVVGQNSNGKTIKLSIDQTKIGMKKKGVCLTEAPTVDAFLPGTAVEFMVIESSSFGVAGKIMGMMDVTADPLHAGAWSGSQDLEKRYPAGSKFKGRLICTFPESEEKKVGVTLLDHILQLDHKTSAPSLGKEGQSPTTALPISSKLESATVTKVLPSVGLILDVGVKGVQGFAHISRISDRKIDILSEDSGPYKISSTHKARVLGYNAMDGLFLLSLEEKVIEQQFLRLEDVKVGQEVKGQIEKLLVGEEGVSGLLIQIADGISALVPENHMADVRLQHPERKFKEGQTVKGKILSVNLAKHQIRLTLKKTLVNSETEPWTSYEQLQPGMQSPGTLINVLGNGAVVQFYGEIRAFLPVAEMSESFIQDPTEHLHVGQVVNVRVVSVKADERRMVVSCKDPATFGEDQVVKFNELKLGSVVEGTVREKTNDRLVLELDAGLKATLPVNHLTDGTEEKSTTALRKIRIDQVLKQLLVLRKDESNHVVKLSSKPSLIRASHEGRMPSRFDDVQQGTEITGFVSNITSIGVFVQFAGDLSALLSKRNIDSEVQLLPDFGMRLSQTVSARVLSVDHDSNRISLTTRPMDKDQDDVEGSFSKIKLVDPVDDTVTSPDDFVFGRVTKVRVSSVKRTQLNVHLASGVQGRIDISSMFDSWDEIPDEKHPLRKFQSGQILSARILGMHDSRNHRFLPISHRAKAPVFEMTAKPSDLKAEQPEVLTLSQVEIGSSWVVYVNNADNDRLWVNLSPNIRGRIRARDATDDVAAMTDLPNAFPTGSALRAKVTNIDVEHNRLDLVARDGPSTPTITLKEVVKGQILPAQVCKVTERNIIVRINEHISGPIQLVDISDDYSQANPWAYSKGQIVRVCVKDVDVPNKKIMLSMRSSRVLSSSSHVEDPDFESAAELKVNDICRGFIKSVADNGLFVTLSAQVTALVRVTDLSDGFIKEWKAGFEVDQLVRGKILLADSASGHIQMSLKESHLNKDYKPPICFNDVFVGQVITGKVRKVEDFGVFVVFDNSANVSGLCHRSEMNDQSRPDPRKLYEEGNRVKALVLSIDEEKRRISLGLKASYFEDAAISEDDDINMSDAQEEDLEALNGDNDSDDNSGVMVEDPEGSDADITDLAANTTYSTDRVLRPNSFQGLSTGGFDWTGEKTFGDHKSDSDSSHSSQPKKRKKKKSTIKVDRTGELDVNGPQTGSDFERLLLGQPNNSALWLGYMAFHLQLGDFDKARDLAERALKTIPIREEGEKLNVWIAMLNLENAYGTDDKIEEVFKRACNYNDPLDISERLISIYIQSSQNDKADDLFQSTLKKHTQAPSLWLNYATFLMTTLRSPDRARSLLPRALQALPKHTHVNLSSQFAKLEFDSPAGEPERGRTIFEQLISTWPKKLDLCNVLLDCEIRIGDVDRVRKLLERITQRKGDGGLKPKKARFFFKKWAGFEEMHGSVKDQERVKGLAESYVKDWEERKQKV